MIQVRDSIDRLMDRRYGVNTRHVRWFDAEEAALTAHGDPTRLASAPYFELLSLRRSLGISDQDVFVDLGCGTGRPVFVFARSRAKRCYGVDFDDTVLDMARRNLRSFRAKRSEVSFVLRDVADLEFSDETIVYLFNPFGVDTLGAVMNRLAESLRARPRRIRVCYYNPVYRDHLEGLTWLEQTGRIPGFWNETLIYEARGGAPLAARYQADKN